MGWTYPFGSSRKDLIAERTEAREWKAGEMLVKTTCLAKCFRGGSFSGVLWVVWERTFTIDGKEARPTERWIGCDMMEYAKQYEGWGYKDLDESMGPCSWSCPFGYLAMVPIDRNGGNADWRAGVMAYHERQLEKRKARVGQR
ncbi:MAG: hypothetical protein HYX68_14105 [Planctomycetes bacterium]|nr:hypothetical protein [Planctomycetota bacterium]